MVVVPGLGPTTHSGFIVIVLLMVIVVVPLRSRSFHLSNPKSKNKRKGQVLATPHHFFLLLLLLPSFLDCQCSRFQHVEWV
uniref:KH domain-containing protein At4g18375 isoform X1 n=1 Tax=Rhizophora mucronata TaxID=61149 RepID=A0A2P2MYP9_RHIMU